MPDGGRGWPFGPRMTAAGAVTLAAPGIGPGKAGPACSGIGAAGADGGAAIGGGGNATGAGIGAGMGGAGGGSSGGGVGSGSLTLMRSAIFKNCAGSLRASPCSHWRSSGLPLKNFWRYTWSSCWLLTCAMSGWSALSPKMLVAISGASLAISSVISDCRRTTSFCWFCFGRASDGSGGCWLGSTESCGIVTVRP